MSEKDVLRFNVWNNLRLHFFFMQVNDVYLNGSRVQLIVLERILIKNTVQADIPFFYFKLQKLMKQIVKLVLAWVSLLTWIFFYVERSIIMYPDVYFPNIRKNIFSEIYSVLKKIFVLYIQRNLILIFFGSTCI